jgi:17beta-estradiol 17-dehydrogenase / very-long-chain 3-oxoacyl-CoA reductase
MIMDILDSASEIFFNIIGVLIVVKVVQYIKLILLHAFYPTDLTKYKGGWAVITGGSDGIGKGIAINLASHGFNLILISRSTEKLQ